jgi:hypothetical protein
MPLDGGNGLAGFQESFQFPKIAGSQIRKSGTEFSRLGSKLFIWCNFVCQKARGVIGIRRAPQSKG